MRTDSSPSYKQKPYRAVKEGYYRGVDDGKRKQLKPKRAQEEEVQNDELRVTITAKAVSVWRESV